MPPSDDRPTFPELVAAELKSARAEWPPIVNTHQGSAIIFEMLCKLWAQIQLDPQRRDPGLLLHRTVQVAAMCQRAAEDVGFLARHIRVPAREPQRVES